MCISRYRTLSEALGGDSLARFSLYNFVVSFHGCVSHAIAPPRRLTEVTLSGPILVSRVRLSISSVACREDVVPDFSLSYSGPTPSALLESPSNATRPCNPRTQPEFTCVSPARARARLVRAYCKSLPAAVPLCSPHRRHISLNFFIAVSSRRRELFSLSEARAAPRPFTFSRDPGRDCAYVCLCALARVIRVHTV